MAEWISTGMRFHGTWNVSGHVFLMVEGDPQSSAPLDSGFESESTLDGLEKGTGDGLLTSGLGCDSVCSSKLTTVVSCSFKQGDKVLVHWIQLKGNTLVQSYYSNRDQLGHQDESFKGRTSLFQDQISKGNASLRLTGVKLEDQGRYKCYTSTTNGSNDSFVDLNLEAPPSKVGIQQVGNRITCSSEEIYPQPELTWSSSPPTNLTVADTPTVHQKEKLYSINSSLIVQVGVIDLDYSCTISAGRNKRRATLFKPASINISDTKTTIPCTSSNTHFKSLIWTFNYSQNILIQTSAKVPFKVSEEWRKHVKDVSESGSLVLQDLTSHQEGIYTCEHSTAEETHERSTALRIEESQSTPDVAGITVGVIVLVMVVLAICIFFIYKRFKKKRKGDENNRELPATGNLLMENGERKNNTFLDRGTTTVSHDEEQDHS